MRRIYTFCWWIWPLLAVVILAAQSVYGRDVFGYFAIPLGISMALGSSVFGSIGLWLAFHSERRLWAFISALIAATPAFIYVALLFQQW